MRTFIIINCIMKKIILVLVLFSFRLISQDTLQFKNGDVKIVKVSEVGINEIKYNRFDNLTGPTYISPKAEIRSIKYSSGHLETFENFKSQPSIATNPNVDPNPSVQKAPSGMYAFEINDFIDVRRRRVSYHGRQLGERRLMQLIIAYPNLKTANIMLDEFKTMKSYKSTQYLTGFLGLGLGLASGFVGLSYFANSPYNISGLLGIPIGIAIGTTGAIISGVFKSKRHQKMIDIAEIYNKGK